MIELERIDPDFWADEHGLHVIIEVSHRHAPGWFVRDAAGERGPYDTFEQAFAAAEKAWGEVTLAPANRLRRDLDIGRADEVGHYLLEYLAEYGPVGIDAQELAKQVFARIGAVPGEEAWQ